MLNDTRLRNLIPKDINKSKLFLNSYAFNETNGDMDMVINPGETIELETELQWFGELLIQEAKYEKIDRGFQVVLDNGLIVQVLFADPSIRFRFSKNGYNSSNI